MKIQRKLLTKEQRKEICSNNDGCADCPLAFKMGERVYSCDWVEVFEKSIRAYYDQAIEVDL